MMRFLLLLGGLTILAVVPLSCQPTPLKFASKKFTESVILGELLTGAAESAGVDADHYQELGGTRLVFNALVNAQIDAYVDYTGTITQEIFAADELDFSQAVDRLAAQGISATEPLGFNNKYAFGMLRDRAKELQIRRLSDLNRYPQLDIGLTAEFVDRSDGWGALKQHYSLNHRNVRGMDHDIAYRQLSSGAIDVMDVYTTDAKIQSLDLELLIDDRQFFPEYQAVVLYRTALRETHPTIVDRLRGLAGKIDDTTMRQLNHAVEIEGETEGQVAAEWLTAEFGWQVKSVELSRMQDILARTVEHLDLVRRSLVPAILLGIPLGIWAARWPLVAQIILGSVGVIQTIPALALLVLLMPLVTWLGGASIGVGSFTAVLALFLYSLLPIVRGTYTGLISVEAQYLDSARALGLTPSYQLWHVELPLALRSIMSGIKTAAVINVGFATLGALIGAGGYGQPILTGIRLDNKEMLLAGAVPAAVLAVVTQLLFDAAEKWLIPRGLQAKQ